MRINEKDKQLLNFLASNSRTPVSELARKLQWSRATVTDRIDKLQQHGIIQGFTVRFGDAHEEAQLLAHVLIEIDPKKSAAVVRALQKIPEVSALHAVNGVYDMIAMIRSESTRTLDQTLDQIGAADGVERTVSSIILSSKFER